MTHNDTTPLDTHPRPSRRRLGLAAAGSALAVASLGLAAYGATSAWGLAAPDATPADGGTADAATADDEGECELAAAVTGGNSGPARSAAAEGEQEALAAYLDERGIAYTLDPTADGPYVVWDDTDPAAADAVDAFYAARYPLTPASAEALSAEDEDEMAAILDRQGVTYTVERDAHGTRFLIWEDRDGDRVVVGEYYVTTGDADGCITVPSAL